MDGIQMELWRDLYVMLGTSAAALVGLLFVVTSLHLDEIVSNEPYRIRARNNIFYLVLMVVEAALILVPQPMRVLGVEFLVICGAVLVLHLRTTYRYHFKDKALGRHGGFLLFPAIRFITTDLVGIAGAVALIARSPWGIYLVTACYIMFLVSVVLNAWTIMLGIGAAEKKTRAS